MATVISGQKSTYGKPYAFYTLDLSCSSRTATSATISYTITARLQYSQSNIGKGYTVTATIYAGNNSVSHTLKASSETWSGTSSRTFTGSFTVTGLSGSTTSISTALYVSSNAGGSAAGLNKTSGDSLSIPEATKYTITYNANGGSGAPPSQFYYYGGDSINLSTTTPTRSGYNFLGWSLSSTATSPSYYPGESWSSSNGNNYTLYAVWEVANGKSSFILSSNTIDLDGTLIMYVTAVNSSNTHKMELTINGTTTTLSSGRPSGSTAWVFKAVDWAKYLTSKSIDGTITLTTYSGSTNLGSVSQGVTLVLPESIGKPDKPSAILSSERFADATIDLKKPNFKYGATFKEWKVENNIGKAKIIGNRVHVGVDPTINKTGVVTIRAVDSRDFISNPVSIQWHKRKQGASIFINGKWVSYTPYLYKDGEYVECKETIYNDYVWYYKDGKIELEDRYLLSSEGYNLVSSEGYTLLGKKG